MKKTILSLVICAALFGCEEDLSKTPDFISETQVFQDKSLTESYVSNLYQRLDFQNGIYVEMATKNAVGAENIGFANWQEPNQASTRLYTEVTGPGPLDNWKYAAIRDMNYLLENIGSSTALEPEYVEDIVAEVRFLRAFEYFEMAKRFGGVPLITQVQNQDDSTEELYVSRSSEKEIYDFIYEETEDILSQYDGAKTGAGGRVDKYTVLMLQSRAMLYAASIARNGEVQLDGLLGIPSELANSYYQKSYDASKEIIDSGMFRLIDDYGDDKVANYASIFTEGVNDETIFAELFEPFIKGHHWDHFAIPAGFSATWNSNFPVLYDFVEMFDFVDGRSGKIDRSQFNAGNEWDIDDFFGNRDPRFRAAVFYQEAPFQGKKVFLHTSTLYTENGEQKESTKEGDIFTTINGDNIPGAGPRRNRVNTALLLRKRVDEDATEPQYNSSGQDYIVFRYAETLLNLAEAGFYLGNSTEALDALNQIRERAGMPLLSEATEENIRHERQVELCFEDQRYFDLVRWRIAEDYLSLRTKGLILRYNLDTDKYIVTLKNAENQEREFEPQRYYLPFGQGRLADNPNLVQNPGY